VQKTGIVIDGNLSEWNSVSGVTFSGDSARGASNNTVLAKAAWDDTNLYLAYDVSDTELISVKTLPDENNIWKDDVLEFFIDTNYDGGAGMQAGDYHFIINLNNVIWDSQGTGSGQDTSWNGSGLLSAVNLNGTLNNGGGDQGYTIEVAIPWVSMGMSPTDGQQIAVDFAVGDADTGDGYIAFDWASIRPFAQPNKWNTLQLSAPQVDNTPPTVSITAPSNGTTVSGSISIQANASDDLGVASVQFLLDGANLGSADVTSPYSIVWNTLNTFNGNHTLSAIATDSSGKSTTSSPITVTVTAGPSEPDDTFSCLNNFAGPTLTISGDQGFTQYYHSNTGNGTRFDARGATWFQDTTPVLKNQYPIDVRMNSNNASVCWAGGLIHNTNPEDISWNDSYNPANNAELISQGGQMTVDGTRFYNGHDGFRPWERDIPLNGFNLKNVWMTYMRDDCIENDTFQSGLVDDSLFDGCYVFLSSRNKGTINGSNEIVTVQNSLIRLQKMPGPFGQNKSFEGHGHLFKYENGSPKLSLHNNIFLIEGLGITSGDINTWLAKAPDTLGFKVAEGKLQSCSNNTIVWLGDGDNDGDVTDDDFPGDIPNDPSCVTVTRDKSVWDNARAKWLNDHPNVMRIPGVDDVPPADTTPPTVSISEPAK